MEYYDLFLIPDHLLSDADELMRKYRISGTYNSKGKLVGIITNRDIRFETDLAKIRML